MEEAVSERRKAFAAAHKSDEDRQACISAFRRALSVIAKAEAWQATCSFLTPKFNPKSVYSLLRSLAGSSYLSLLTFPTVPLPGSRLPVFHLRRLPEIPLFCFPAKGFA